METINKAIQTEQLSLGFVGLGWIGRNRMEKLLTSRAIVEPMQDNIESALALDKNIQLFDSLDEWIADPSIEGVVIATPSGMHTKQTIAALMAGKAVFCQKSLGRNFDEVEQAIKASAKMNKLLSVDFSYRHTEAFDAFKNINGFFYDFTAEKYQGTQTETLVSPPDDWSGKVGLVWAEAVMEGKGYDPITSH